MQDPYSRELEVAADAVRRAADRYVRSDGAPSEEKENAVGSYDLVTYSDRQAQEDIIRTISVEFPGDLFIAEEGEENSLTDARTWVIDPIDGTLNYERGIPMFGTQLVLMVGKEPVMSVIYLPVPEEMFTATVADGVRLNGMPVKPCGGHDLKKCIVSTGDFSRKKQEWRDIHYTLIGAMKDEVARIRMFGAACVDFAYLASGRTDIHIRFVNKLWDFMPGLFMARVSGAYVDEELLSEKRFLLLTRTAEEASQYRDIVLSQIDM